MAETTMSEDQHALQQGRTFSWHELYTPDFAASVEFYRNALGFGVTEMELGEMGTYHMLTRNETAVCGIWDTRALPEMADAPPHWAVYLSVEDVDARIEECQKHGASVLAGPMNIPTVGRIALIQDPQGALIRLFQPEPW
jgi:predicted enzyme related to lactoylglutathione lyase